MKALPRLTGHACGCRDHEAAAVEEGTVTQACSVGCGGAEENITGHWAEWLREEEGREIKALVDRQSLGQSLG